MSLYGFASGRYVGVLLFSALLVSGCSGSGDSSSEGSVTVGSTLADSMPVENGSDGTASGGTNGVASGAANGNEAVPLSDSSSPGADPVTSPTVNPTPEPPVAVSTRVDFNITVSVYVSDSLQVQLTWGDRTLVAGWVVDETWSVSDELPSDTENPLTVTFSDRNGAVVLGQYETRFRTGTSPSEIVEIFADQFDSSQWDDNGDGVSNLDESIAGGDPLATPVVSAQNTVRVDFGVIVPAIMSDALQVRLDWGDEVINASWAGDEVWTAFADLPTDTEETLTITFSDRNGELPLGNYETTYQTGNNGSEYFQVESRQINTFRFDSDIDGVSNYREVLAETDPLVSDSSVPVSFAVINERISQGRCAGCHSVYRDSDDLYDTFITSSRGYVVPFEPEESRLVEKLEGSMLRFGGADLAELVRTWVTLGALDN